MPAADFGKRQIQNINPPQKPLNTLCFRPIFRPSVVPCNNLAVLMLYAQICFEANSDMFQPDLPGCARRQIATAMFSTTVIIVRLLVNQLIQV